MSRERLPHIGTCQRCRRPIRVGQPYMPRIPFVGSWGGFDHQFCPPRLVRPTNHLRDQAQRAKEQA